MQTIWNKKTGEALQREPVDVREILAASPELYTSVELGKSVDVAAVAEPVGLRAVHRGRGSYSIMSGDVDIEEAGSLDKSEAATFNAMDEAGKAEFVAARKTATV